MLAVCEVFDTMAHRSYHGANTTVADAVVELISNTGTLYDSSVVNALLEVLDTEDSQIEFVPQSERELVAAGATRVDAA